MLFSVRRKTISVLVFDLSDNSLVRVYPIVKVLSRRYNVEIIGVVFGDEIYNPYQNEFNFKTIRKNRERGKLISYFLMVRDVIKSIKGDVIYAFKPKFFSFGVGVLVKLYRRIPLVLDIEDFETANWYKKPLLLRVKLIFDRFDLENEFVNYIVEKLIPLANEKIVVSRFLQDKFGGIKIVHGVDTNTFNPNLFNKTKIRGEIGLAREHKYILFSGMPREHKGIEELMVAIKKINRNDLKLLMVGGDIEHPYFKTILEIGGQSIVPIGPRPHNEMPKYLAASDIVVLPQRETLFANAQIPAKVFEAMAMGKPIISTNVSDLGEILDGCGIIIDPICSIDDSTELEGNIKALIDDNGLAARYGALAREKCVEQYSWDQMEKKLLPVFEKYL